MQGAAVAISSGQMFGPAAAAAPPAAPAGGPVPQGTPFAFGPAPSQPAGGFGVGNPMAEVGARAPADAPWVPRPAGEPGSKYRDSNWDEKPEFKGVGCWDPSGRKANP